MLFLANEGQNNKSNCATKLFMSKQVSLPKISSNLQILNIGPKCYVALFARKPKFIVLNFNLQVPFLGVLSYSEKSARLLSIKR